MARYIDADTMIADLAKLENEYLYADGDTEKYEFVYGTLTGVRQAITYAKAQPTADVAPKSEVDLYRKQVDELEDELASTYDKLENAKNEVIQAILSLIDDKIRYEVELYNGFNSARPFKPLCQERVNALNDLKLIINYQFRAELKNKYTEAGNNEN